MEIHVVYPHLALFGSAPSYEHPHVFGCTCYPNTTTTAPYKLSPRSTWCVFLGYSADNKGYRCLDLSINRLIISRHVIFDEHSFPLTALPSPTDLDFLCESGPTVSIIGTHLTTEGTSTPAPRRPPLEIPLGFEPPVAPLPASVVPPGFLPLVDTTTAPHAITDGSPPHTWPASPIIYVRQEVGAGTARTRGAPGAALCREVGASAVGTLGASGATMSREEGAGAVGTCGAPGAALRREVGAGAPGTHDTPGATLQREVGTRAAGTRGTPRAALSQEVHAGATGTRGALGAALSREVGAGAPGTRVTPHVSKPHDYVNHMFMRL
jgi:hypothetical protein